MSTCTEENENSIENGMIEILRWSYLPNIRGMFIDISINYIKICNVHVYFENKVLRINFLEFTFDPYSPSVESVKIEKGSIWSNLREKIKSEIELLPELQYFFREENEN